MAPLPTIAGQTAFFDGTVTAAAKVGVLTGFDRRGDGTAGEGGKSGGPPGRRGGFSMGGMGVSGASGLGPDGDLRGPPPGGGGGPGGNEGGPPAGNRPRGPSAVPPVMIHLRFTNHGTEKIEIVIADFLSALGNFVTFPSRLTLEPGQSAEVEPMTSRLAGDATGADITLRLRLGSREETKVISLQPEAPAPSPAPAPKP